MSSPESFPEVTYANTGPEQAPQDVCLKVAIELYRNWDTEQLEGVDIVEDSGLYLEHGEAVVACRRCPARCVLDWGKVQVVEVALPDYSLDSCIVS